MKAKELATITKEELEQLRANNELLEIIKNNFVYLLRISLNTRKKGRELKADETKVYEWVNNIVEKIRRDKNV